jgi:hypothetical protein
MFGFCLTWRVAAADIRLFVSLFPSAWFNRHLPRSGLYPAAFSLGLIGCTAPPLSHVINNAPFGGDISVEDVVLRVKCELADSVVKKMKEQNLKWLENWVAKADLTLQVNESGGITPNAVFTQPLHNVFNLGSGPSSVSLPRGNPGTTVSATSQSFNVGIGATYSNQVFRTETLSFAVSLSELKAWRERGKGRYANCRSSPNRVGVFPSFLPDLFTERSASLPRGCA